MKKMSVALPAALAVLIGCSSSNLTMDQALQRVKDDAGVSDSVTMVEQSYSDDQYHFIFEDGSSRYDYVIEEDGDFVSKNITGINLPSPAVGDDATTTTVESTPIPRPQPGQASGNDSTSSDAGDLSMIPSEILTQFSVDTTTVRNVRSYEEKDDGRTYTQVDFVNDFGRYEITLDGTTLVEYEYTIPKDQRGDDIGQDQALQALCDILGVSSSDVTIYEQEYDRHDLEYEFEGVFGDEAIDAVVYQNGVIHSVDYK